MKQDLCIIYKLIIWDAGRDRLEPSNDWRHKADQASLKTNVYNYFLRTIFVAFYGLLRFR